MIKVVKQGETIFKMVCPQCNCIYTYEIGDLITLGTYCPCCSYFNPHYSKIESNSSLNIIDINAGRISWQKAIDDSLSSTNEIK